MRIGFDLSVSLRFKLGEDERRGGGEVRRGGEEGRRGDEHFSGGR